MCISEKCKLLLKIRKDNIYASRRTCNLEDASLCKANQGKYYYLPFR